MDKNIDKAKIAADMMATLKELEAENETTELLKDNSIVFEVEKKTYRMHKPTSLERRKIDDFRRKKYATLLKDDTYLFKKQWIEEYKKKGVSIKDKEAHIATLNAKMSATLLRLAASTTPQDIKTLKEEAQAIKLSQYEASVEIANLLSDSIESVLLMAVNLYVGFIVLEVKDGENWKPAYTDYEEFTVLEGALVNKVIYYLNCLLYSGKDLYELSNTATVS